MTLIMRLEVVISAAHLGQFQQGHDGSRGLPSENLALQTPQSLLLLSSMMISWEQLANISLI